MKRTVMLVILCLALAGTVWADEPPRYDRVQLDAGAETRIANDTLIARLYAQAEGKDPAALAERVNEHIRWAVERLKARPAIRVQTESYSTQPVYRDGTITGWRVRQSLRLESTDIPAVGEALGELQQRLALAGLQFTISPTARRQHQDRLIQDALRAFQARARLIADTLGHSGYRLVHLTIHHGGPVVSTRALPMAAMAKTTPPALEAGQTTLRVTVQGEIELR